ncbi:MAG: PEP-CTERM sorting domain-containing protein [Fimbriimonadia bacterium]|jgi:hypothetical protein
MHVKKAFRLSLVGGIVAVAVAANAAPIVQWNFNSVPPDGNTGTGTTVPNINLTGSASISLLGGVTNPGFNSGVGSSDPAASDNSGYQTTTYAAQGTENGLRGVAFFGSTLGYQDIVVNFDLRHSNTSSRFAQLEYTLDGGSTWTFGGLFEADLGGDKWYNVRTVDLTSVAGANNNPLFGFKVVAVFAPGTGGYLPSTPTSTYGPNGTWRFDMVTINGNLIPEPGTIAALAVGVVGLMARRRRK